jgi:hypothetical protein
MIFPSITDAQAATAVKYALKRRKKFWQSQSVKDAMTKLTWVGLPF